MVGGVPFLSPSSRARSAGWTVCAALHGSDGCFSCPRTAGTETSAADAANKTATAETKEFIWKRLVADANDFPGETLRFVNEGTCGFTEIAAYFLSSARVRCSFMAVVRRVSGIFLLEVRLL